MNLKEVLNPEQQIAVDNVDGPILVLAGAGSGKTRVITFRIIELLRRGIEPSQILGLTFTNKAANEMKERVKKLTNSEVLICTFHSLGARILRESISLLGYTRSFTIYDEDDVERLLKSCMEDCGIKADLKTIREGVSSAKNNMIGPEEVEKSKFSKDQLFIKLYTAYQAKLQLCNALDFDDLLFLTVRLFKEYPESLELYQERWSHFLVDEFQDTNAIQYHLLKQLVDKHKNICVVGDPDQSIYSWRGADIDNILNFEDSFPNAKIIKLDQNYRSRTNILDAANALIAKNKNRYEKRLWSDRGPGEKIRLYRADDENAEARFVAECILHHHEEQKIPLNQMVVFYRTNAQSRPFEDCFLRYRIPYAVVGSVSFYQRREIKDILAWLRIVHSGTDQISFERTINLPKRGIGDTTLEKIRIAASQDRSSIYNYCEHLLKGETSFPVKLNAKQQSGLQEYIAIVHELRERSKQTSLAELIKSAIHITGYQRVLDDDPDSREDRMENLNALVSKAADSDKQSAETQLTNFLEELSLKSSLDEANDFSERVSLMTIHNGKGLEFEVAILAGMEEGLFPHANSLEQMNAIEEERRLCYVGMTRAKEYLYITYVSLRFIWGAKRQQRSSRFLSEIPREYVERLDYRRREYTQSFQIEKRVPPVESDAFTAGSWVFHNEFGLGHIREVADGSAGLTYRILFTKDNVERSVVAKFAQLSKI